ncbi:MAG: ATP-binding cassette domain-containing protein [Anaerolineales bacterium]
MTNELALRAEGLTKDYGQHRAVDELSFELKPGEIFGLLGPNGAGKTTTIRMVLDIIKPTAGSVDVLGGPMTEAKKGRIGYLPEERGLYEDMKLLETLQFFGQLKGLSSKQAAEAAEAALKDLDLWSAHDKKVRALSRGMRQKAQFIAATLHDPELLIIDEPFSGLDPVNTRKIKEKITGLRDRGVAVIMSTHQLHQVEELCERILLVNQGRGVLYGRLDEIRSRFGGNVIEVDATGDIQPVPGVDRIEKRDGSHRLILAEGVHPESVLRGLVAQNAIQISRFERSQPSLEEIFVQTVGMTAYPTGSEGGG